METALIDARNALADLGFCRRVVEEAARSLPASFPPDETGYLLRRIDRATTAFTRLLALIQED